MKDKKTGNFIQRHYKRIRQISAIGGIILLLLIYIVAFIAAILSSPSANALFMASLYCTLIIPGLVYGFQLICKVFGGKAVDTEQYPESDTENDTDNNN